MAIFFSDHFAAIPNVAEVTEYLAPRGITHSRKRQSIATLALPVGMDLADNDIIKLISFFSHERIGEIVVTSDGLADSGGTLPANLGLFKSDDDSEIDEDLFASAVDLDAAIARTDHFVEATTLGNLDRYKTAWELATIGLQAYTEDPRESWYLGFRATSNWGAVVTASFVTVEVQSVG